MVMPKQKKTARKKENEITIEKIHSYYRQLFIKYNYKLLSPNIEEKNMWCDFISGRLNLDANEFWHLNSEFFWSLLNVEISIGYVLVARQSCLYPFGTEKISYDRDDTMPDSGVAEVHYWYHINNARECIYRCWERITNILNYVCYNKKHEKYYYNTMISKISKDKKYSANPKIELLKTYE